MNHRSRRPAAAGALAVLLGLLAGAAGPTGRWAGQDGHDLVGKAATPGPSLVQDLHFVLDGLPARAKVVSGVVHGEGSGEWKVDGPPGSWLALVQKPPGSTSADVYIEPYQPESGRMFFFELVLDDGRKLAINVRGGRADPNLRVASARLAAAWGGQDARDLVAPSPNAGPDGIRDVHLVLSHLAEKDEVRSVLLAGPGGLRWQFGPNLEAHPRAEFLRDPRDRSRGTLVFHSSKDLAGATLRLTLTYENGLVDEATLKAGRSDPRLKVAAAAVPTILPLHLKPRWLGQRGPGGEVAVALEGLPAGRLVGVDLSDGDAGAWSNRERGDLVDPLPLAVRRGPDPARAEFSFPPIRDESGATMTLRLILADGRSAVGTFPGGPCDPALRSAAPASSSARAKPGDDLQGLVDRHGTVTLGPGTYTLRRPLVLSRPVALRAAGDASIVFAPEPGGPAWSSAIEIGAGRTTLEGFAVRFAAPVKWDANVSYGPAVIGTKGAGLAGLRLRRLVVELPAGPGWDEATRTVRGLGATSGVIEECRFKGGMIELWGGPWTIRDNAFDGTPAGTFAQASLAIHESHDVAIERNKVRPADPLGKTWRWLVLVNRGSNLRVAGNSVEGVGPRDDDRHEHPNAPETILTESYRLHFEGKPLGQSPDGRVVVLPPPQEGPIGVGEVAAILSGPEAGTWRRVVLPLGGNAYLLDRPANLGGGALAIGPGFVTTSFESNEIDDRGSKVAIPFVLAGQHFGTRLVGNSTRGGGVAARVVATATESPGPWGWSHTAMFGLAIEANTFEDAWEGLTLCVEHNHLTRPSRGRVYATARIAENLFSATAPFLAKRGSGWAPATIGEAASGDPGELVVTASGNRSRGLPAGSAARVRQATVNGRAVADGRIDLPAVPADSTRRRDGARP